MYKESKFITLALLLTSVVCSYAMQHNDQNYIQLKNAVFSKMGQKFEATFSQKYPQPTEESVIALAQCIDSISGWQECCPPRATATIGSQKIPLRGEIANIIYDWKN